MKVTYKTLLDSEGSVTGVEVWQGSQHITLSLAGEGTHKNGYRWTEVKETLDKIAERVHDDSGYNVKVTQLSDGRYRSEVVED